MLCLMRISYSFWKKMDSQNKWLRYFADQLDNFNTECCLHVLSWLIPILTYYLSYQRYFVKYQYHESSAIIKLLDEGSVRI